MSQSLDTSAAAAAAAKIVEQAIGVAHGDGFQLVKRKQKVQKQKQPFIGPRQQGTGRPNRKPRYKKDLKPRNPGKPGVQVSPKDLKPKPLGTVTQNTAGQASTNISDKDKTGASTTEKSALAQGVAKQSKTTVPDGKPKAEANVGKQEASPKVSNNNKPKSTKAKPTTKPMKKVNLAPKIPAPGGPIISFPVARGEENVKPSEPTTGSESVPKSGSDENDKMVEAKGPAQIQRSSHNSTSGQPNTQSKQKRRRQKWKKVDLANEGPQTKASQTQELEQDKLIKEPLAEECSSPKVIEGVSYAQAVRAGDPTPTKASRATGSAHGSLHQSSEKSDAARRAPPTENKNPKLVEAQSSKNAQRSKETDKTPTKINQSNTQDDSGTENTSPSSGGTMAEEKPRKPKNKKNKKPKNTTTRRISSTSPEAVAAPVLKPDISKGTGSSPLNEKMVLAYIPDVIIERHRRKMNPNAPEFRPKKGKDGSELEKEQQIGTVSMEESKPVASTDLKTVSQNTAETILNQAGISVSPKLDTPKPSLTHGKPQEDDKENCKQSSNDSIPKSSSTKKAQKTHTVPSTSERPPKPAVLDVTEHENHLQNQGIKSRDFAYSQEGEKLTTTPAKNVSTTGEVFGGNTPGEKLKNLGPPDHEAKTAEGKPASDTDKSHRPIHAGEDVAFGSTKSRSPAKSFSSNEIEVTPDTSMESNEGRPQSQDSELPATSPLPTTSEDLSSKFNALMADVDNLRYSVDVPKVCEDWVLKQEDNITSFFNENIRQVRLSIDSKTLFDHPDWALYNHCPLVTRSEKIPDFLIPAEEAIRKCHRRTLRKMGFKVFQIVYDKHDQKHIISVFPRRAFEDKKGKEVSH